MQVEHAMLHFISSDAMLAKLWKHVMCVSPSQNQVNAHHGGHAKRNQTKFPQVPDGIADHKQQCWSSLAIDLKWLSLIWSYM